MKKITAIIILLFVINGYSQEKKMNLNDAVLGYYKGLYPKSMASLQFVDANKYIYREGKTFIIKEINSGKEQKIELKTMQKSLPELKRLPRIMDVNAVEITFLNKNNIIKYDYINNSIKKIVSFDPKATNTDFEKGNGNIAYTLKNNLYIATANVEKMAITNFKDENIVAGQAIARYEFGISKGIFWSPRGNYLAFYQKDETHVTDYPLVDVTTYPATINNVKYPMAGQKSELASIGVYNLATKETVYLKIDTTDEHYLTNLSWSPDEKKILVAEVNRAQDHFEYNSYSPTSGKKIKTLFTESNSRWVEPENDAVFLPNSNTDFLWLSERDGYKNIYHYTTKGKLISQVTKFKFVIKSILGFDTSRENVLVSATGENGTETLVYKVNIKCGDVMKITSEKGTHRTQLKGDYIIDNFSNLTTPRKIKTININSLKETTVFSADNPLENYSIGTTEIGILKSPEGFDLYTRMIKPANFDPSKKYPVLVYVYGGTHAQMITNSWLGGSSLWMQWFATEHNYIIYTLDNRGSGNRGFAFESVIHRKGGEPAMEDQLIGMAHLKTLPYIDANRIAVHGWSYGGYMSSSLLLQNPNLYTTAVSGGPVTDWKYYEIMYGERYMDTPQENPEGYENTRVAKYIENLGNNKLLIIHGSVDPTVVPQHSMTLLQEAVKKNVQIDFFTYPMHPHNVRGKDRVHLMQKVLDYILEHNK